MSLIGLKVSEKDPSKILMDIVNMPATIYLGFTIQYFNYDGVTLYFQITGSGTGWTFGTVNLGALGTGANAHIHVDDLATRAKPASETDESLVLTLKAYTDAGYSNLKWTESITIPVSFIKSDDPSYTVDILNNFDDGTVQGWSAVNELNAVGITCAVATDYVLSALYSLKSTAYSSTNPAEMRWHLEKTFTTPNKTVIYAVCDIRTHSRGAGYAWNKNVQIGFDGTILTRIGKPYNTGEADDLPVDEWFRLVVPLPKNVSMTFKIILDCYFKFTAGAYDSRIWLDDFKVISK